MGAGMRIIPSRYTGRSSSVMNVETRPWMVLIGYERHERKCRGNRKTVLNRGISPSKEIQYYKLIPRTMNCFNSFSTRTTHETRSTRCHLKPTKGYFSIGGTSANEKYDAQKGNSVGVKHPFFLEKPRPVMSRDSSSASARVEVQASISSDRQLIAASGADPTTGA